MPTEEASGMSEEKRRRLLEMLLERSYQYRPEKPFTLSSGRVSPYFIDCKPVTNSAAGLALVGEIFFDLVAGLDIAAIGGLTMGADPIAHAVSLISWQKGRPVNSFSVRKLAKDHGHESSRVLVGYVRSGDRVAIVDDVITTGQSTIQAMEQAAAGGLLVVKAVVLVDREEGGKEEIEKRGVGVESVFTLSELREEAAKRSTGLAGAPGEGARNG